MFPMFLQQLLTEEEFSYYLQRGLSVAENSDPTSVHCRTANCNGWCFFEDDVNVFYCQVFDKLGVRKVLGE